MSEKGIDYKKLAKHFQHGNMPYKLYIQMLEVLQKRYKKIWKGKDDHLHGRPMSPEEKAVQRKQVAARKKKRKAAKQARKKNRSK